jgi:hypothetical protein
LSKQVNHKGRHNAHHRPQDPYLQPGPAERRDHHRQRRDQPRQVRQRRHAQVEDRLVPRRRTDLQRFHGPQFGGLRDLRKGRRRQDLLQVEQCFHLERSQQLPVSRRDRPRQIRHEAHVRARIRDHIQTPDQRPNTRRRHRDQRELKKRPLDVTGLASGGRHKVLFRLV